MSDASEADDVQASGPFGNQPQPKITTPCPTCGGRSLFIGDGGGLTCARLGCPTPSVEASIEARTNEHVRVLRELRTCKLRLRLAELEFEASKIRAELGS
jgi:hypothetical protein